MRTPKRKPQDWLISLAGEPIAMPAMSICAHGLSLTKPVSQPCRDWTAGSRYLSEAITTSAREAEDCGFWPVSRFPSLTTWVRQFGPCS